MNLSEIVTVVGLLVFALAGLVSALIDSKQDNPEKFLKFWGLEDEER